MTDSSGNKVLNMDEIQAFVDSRYISAPEAHWRLSKYEMHAKSHTVVRLPVHKPNEQEVYFAAGEEETAVESASTRDTMLTAWFKLNQKDADARSILYHDIPIKYRFEIGAWKKRVNETGGKAIGRMYAVNPRDCERFYLRLLLLHVAGPLSFTDLQSVNGETFATIKDSARARGLLENSDHWIQCMEEASGTAMPAAMRCLFVTILICGNLPPSDARNLWQTYNQAMSEDFRRNRTPDAAIFFAYTDVNKRLDSFGVSLLRPYQISEPPRPSEFQEEIIDKKAELKKGSEMFAPMNEGQKTVTNAVMDAVHERSNERCIFVGAPGGTGKTFVFTAIAHQLTGEGISVVCMASTGIAGNLLPRGTTVHTGTGLPLKLDSNSRLAVSSRNHLGIKLRNAKVFLWDEAPMSSAMALETIDVSLRELMQNNLPFGEKVMVLGGDYRQVLPVIERGNKAQQLAASLKRSQLWRFFKTYKLHQNLRAENGQEEFCHWLLGLGEGKLPVDENDEIEVPECCISSGNIIQEVFGDIIPVDNTEKLLGSVILCPTNDETLEIIDEIVEKIEGAAATYESIDSITCEEGEDPTEFPEEFLYTLTPNGLPPQT
ncbi:uncharacterized protein LOC129583443 [Paramacrobiotus metropolitanus]|uniref:uncharacterized protein LOC129583443 n=1 Tax=Paramacrobiotus metropolitanus TaxID=2943436 RepID=UPI002445C411|nr:uncharacterized protein LOC129583443 [Paramacrobiotus metropolitanus]